MSELIDPEILMMIGIFIISFLLLNVLFKYVSMPGFLKRILIIAFIVGNGFMVFNYIDKVQNDFVEVTNNYIVGEVEFVSKTVKKIEVDFKNSNLGITYTGKVVVNVPGSAKIYEVNSAGVAHLIDMNDLKIGDSITIFCKESRLEGEEPTITAIKINKRAN